MEVVFDGLVAAGKHELAVYTRCGNGSDYRVVRISHKVRAEDVKIVADSWSSHTCLAATETWEVNCDSDEAHTVSAVSCRL